MKTFGNQKQEEKLGLGEVTANALTKFKSAYAVVTAREIRSWHGFLIIGFISGFVAAMMFSVSKELLTISTATPSKTINNTAVLEYTDILQKKYPKVTSNTVLVTTNITGASQIDSTPPSAVSDLGLIQLNATTFKLAWTASGDDGALGMSERYEIRQGTKNITDVGWATLQQVSQNMKPKRSGEKEEVVISSLVLNTTYYFALKVYDNEGNASALSNVVSASTGSLPPPPPPPPPPTTETPSSGKNVSLVKASIKSPDVKSKEFASVKIIIKNSVTKAEIAELVAQSDKNGVVTYTSTLVNEGTYDFIIKVPGHLTKVVRAYILTGASAENMIFDNILAGNLKDDDDEINSRDWGVFSAKWGKTDLGADFNQDGVVNSLDWSVMNKNFGKKGEASNL